MPVVPGYRYLGPGNKINSGDAVNEADLVAQVHDLEYSTAQDDIDIRASDAKAIKRFEEARQREHSWGAVIGETGIAAKYAVESVTGVLYGGGMKRKHNFGNELYKSRQESIYSAFNQAAKEGRYNDLRSFRAGPEYQEILQNHRAGGSSYKRVRSDFDARNSGRRPDDTAESDSPAASEQNEPVAGPSNAPDDIDHIDPNFDWDEFLRGFDVATADANEAALPEPMDATASGTDRGPNTGARSSAPTIAGGASSAGGNGSVGWIPRSIPAQSSSVNFKKSRVLYSYAFSTQNIQKDLIEHMTTSLALIPVDFLPFYLTKSEFENLPYGSRVTKVWCTVKPLGTRTAFDTGTTLSGSATSEYIPLGMSVVGANNSFYGRNQKYSVLATAPMVPTGTSPIKPDEIIDKYYHHPASNAMMVPRSISEYYVHEWNRSGNPDAGKYPEYQIHEAGVARMDEKVDQFMVNQVIGQPVVQYVYVPKNGSIREAKDHFVPYDRRDFTVESHFARARGNKLKFFKTPDGKPDIGIVGLGDVTKPITMNNQTESQYARQIENYGALSLKSGVTPYDAQPQVHVGLIATPQLNPGNEDKNFLNSCCYWQVECGASVSFSISSAFTKGSAISWPGEVTFVENGAHNYTDGQTLFGMTDAGIGNIKSQVEQLEREDEDLGLTTRPIRKRCRGDIFEAMNINN
uniref:Putative VP1 n=1 Tax=Periparus ater ambidensovirus TaxID=2794455 RepID=A0A8A4XDB8_9VIRU|nr:MAG: putative VP1 [Periparus ater ambidensovirus]